MEENNIKLSELEKALDELGIESGMPTLKAFAMALEVPYQRLRGIAKRPEPGTVYDPNAMNWFAITRYIVPRLDKDDEKKFATLEDVVLKAVECDVELKENDKRHFRVAAGDKVITLPDGTECVARRKEWAEGQSIVIHGDKSKTVYVIVCVSQSHICVKKDQAEELRVFGNSTVNAKFREATEEDIDAYLNALAEDAETEEFEENAE